MMAARIAALLRNLLRRGAVDRRLDAEVRAYFELLVDEKMAAGLPPEAARRAARLEIEGVEQVKERVRDRRAGAWLDHLARDLAFALRSHAKAPGATAIIVATLALGIAATSISFSLINGFFIRPLPIDRPERFVRLYNSYKQGDPYFTFSYPDFADMRALGAQDRDIAGLVVGQALALVVMGIAAGLAAGLGSVRLLRTLLIAVDAADPVVFGVAPLVLLAVCAAAAWLPTRRAVRISAATALRYE